MHLTRIIAVSLLCLSLALGGFPMQAKAAQPCPMAAKIQMQHMAMKGCKACDKMTRQEQQNHHKKNGCCGDMACAAQCSSMSNIVPALPGDQFAALSPGVSAMRFYAGDRLLASHLRGTQDRPPKSLS